MANDEHVAMLKQGVASWNAWRDENRNVLHPNLHGADLSGADLKSGGPPWGESQRGEPHRGGSRWGEPQPDEPHEGEPRQGGPHGDDPHWGEPHEGDLTGRA
jgi:hypothetical protein